MKFNEEGIARLRAVVEAFAAALTFGGGTAQAATCFVSSMAYPTIQSAVNNIAATGSTRLAYDVTSFDGRRVFSQQPFWVYWP